MKFSLDFLAMALCGLATIVAVAAILVTSDLLRRFVLFLIARVERLRRAHRPEVVRVAAAPPVGRADDAPVRPPAVSRTETFPG